MSKLISGNIYSLKDFFSGENEKIIIPDLQRDYCWGNPYSTDSKESLVDSFLDSLFKLDVEKDITMGLIYGYYDELKHYQLQLCDGQQRLTTLFLILGVLNRFTDNRYRELLISNFELHEDDKEPHLLYGIRESSLYFLSDLTTCYFLEKQLPNNEIENQYWFLNSYKQDPTILCILRALNTIESRLKGLDQIEVFGDFLKEHVKFLFYDTTNRQNGEETFVVINTTGEPLSANQNLKPLIIIENPCYSRFTKDHNGFIIEHKTAQDWEEMETWFWQKRRQNETDTSTEGMLAFLHCVRVLESISEEEWHHTIDIDDEKFPLSITMNKIWEWFCAYKRVYELDYSRLHIANIKYPEHQSHYTQKELYSILPTMVFCRNNKDASDTEIQRVFHLFSNMGRYRTVIRSSQNESLNVPAYRTCQLVRLLPSKDILSFLDFSDFNIAEEINKLSFINGFKGDEQIRRHIEETLAQAESFDIYEGRVSTLVSWSEKSLEKLDYYYGKIKELWMDSKSRNKLRRALLAFGINDYPMSTASTNMTLCSKTEWRELFEKQGEQIKAFINSKGVDYAIENHKNTDSPYYPLIHREEYLEFCKDHKIRVHAQGVIELMAKTRARASFLLFHRGQVFEKDMVDMSKWDGFWVWSDNSVSVFYSDSYKLNITLDMQIVDNGYRIVAWLDRRPAKKTVKTELLTKMGFSFINEEWALPVIASPLEAKKCFIQLTQRISEAAE